MAVTYTFRTDSDGIVPAVYAADDIGGEDLNTDDTETDTSGVLTLSLPVGDYVATWGDHQTAGQTTQRDVDYLSTATPAAEVTYDNTTSGLTAEEVQAALDEIVVRVEALEAP